MHDRDDLLAEQVCETGLNLFLVKLVILAPRRKES